MSEIPEITPERSLGGWRWEFCIELLGAGAAKVFVRAVEHSSFKASELQKGVLFERVDARFRNVDAFVDSVRGELERLAESAVRSEPHKGNLYRVVEYDHAAWDRVQLGIQRWQRR
ncbi:MAG: hypothetical protein KGL43_28690 [Burkholderiales bacterium]|nr:hypothetical protein [Burkholderiales bacterium]MDE2398430.1 hypothetical protein [Burkholderiales bacterium]MDE2457588.1 hypothetical protein [Burkholderiales bacterium]